MSDYSKITQEEYDNILQEMITENASTLITIPGVYEVLAEHFNNEILDRWDCGLIYVLKREITGDEYE